MAGNGPTEELAAKDSYLSRAEGRVLEVSEDGLFLDRTVFYARGGGQPGDVGTIVWDGGSVEVVDTIRRDGKPFHVVAADSVLPDPGTPVEGAIDWDRRYVTMRTHTALHALSGVIYRDFGAKVTGGNMTPGEARMDFELDSISVEFGNEVERKLNEELVKGYPTEIIVMAREIALQDPRLDPDQGQPDTRVRHRDQGGRHQGSRPTGRWRHSCQLDPRGGAGRSGQDRVEGQGEQAHEDPGHRSSGSVTPRLAGARYRDWIVRY